MSTSSRLDRLHDRIDFAQKQLSKAQGVPVVGPLFASPIKASFSTVQTLAGLVGATVFIGPHIIGLCMPNQEGRFPRTSKNLIDHSVKHMGEGAFELGYSLANIVTLGILGGCCGDCTGDKDHETYC